MNLKSAFCSLILILFTSQSFAFQANRIPDQVEILSKLTGHGAIKPGVVLKDRYAQESREIAASYLKDKLAVFCLESVIENYSPTGNNVVGTILETNG